MNDTQSLVAKVSRLDPRSGAALLKDESDARIADLLSRMHIGHAVEVLERNGLPPAISAVCG